MGKFTGQVALVTASTEGIGFAIARSLGQEGAHVVICSRKAAKVDRAVKTLKNEGISITGMPCHVGKPENRKAILDKIRSEHGKLDILVCNAAVNPYFGNILGTPESAYDKIFDVNVKSTFMLIKEAAPMMEERKNSSIVIVSSLAAYDPSELLGIYSVSKTALIGLTKALSFELAAKKIRINCIAPGIIKTKFSDALFSQVSEETFSQNLPIGRVGVPEDCSGAVSFLCSDAASFITGETIVMAGGVKSRL